MERGDERATTGKNCPRRVAGLYVGTYCFFFAVLMLLVYLNAVAEFEEFFERGLSFGWPRMFWFYSEFTWLDFLFDLTFWSVILIGIIPPVEAWISNHGHPQFSLGTMFGLVSGIALYLNFHWLMDGFESAPIKRFRDINVGFYYCICIVFGIAVTGWLRLAAKCWLMLMHGWPRGRPRPPNS